VDVHEIVQTIAREFYLSSHTCPTSVLPNDQYKALLGFLVSNEEISDWFFFFSFIRGLGP